MHHHKFEKNSNIILIIPNIASINIENSDIVCGIYYVLIFKVPPTSIQTDEDSVKITAEVDWTMHMCSREVEKV